MSLVRCARIGCPHYIRKGLVRPGWKKGDKGQPLADGRFCWRCRQGRRSHLRELPKGGLGPPPR